jgi:hypothetical protein
VPPSNGFTQLAIPEWCLLILPNANIQFIFPIQHSRGSSRQSKIPGHIPLPNMMNFFFLVPTSRFPLFANKGCLLSVHCAMRSWGQINFSLEGHFNWVHRKEGRAKWRECHFSTPGHTWLLHFQGMSDSCIFRHGPGEGFRPVNP